MSASGVRRFAGWLIRMVCIGVRCVRQSRIRYRRYMSLDSLTQARIRLIEPDDPEEVTAALEPAIG